MNHRLTYEHNGKVISHEYTDTELSQDIHNVNLHHEVLDIMLSTIQSESKITTIAPLKPKTIEMSISEYEELLSDSQFLSYLEDSGVTSWTGYKKAVELQKSDLHSLINEL